MPEAAGQAFTAPTGAAADVIVAAHQGAQIAARLIKVGAKVCTIALYIHITMLLHLNCFAEL